MTARTRRQDPSLSLNYLPRAVGVSRAALCPYLTLDGELGQGGKSEC